MIEAINERKNLKLIIESAGEGLGYYLYIFDLNSEIPKADHLCDNLEEAYLIAEEDYNILKNEFKFIDKN